MLRSRPLWIVIASFGGIMPAARAEEPPCPSQNAQAAASAPAATGSTAAAPAPDTGPAPTGATPSSGTGQPSGS
ncbi:MAG TPA: hypothetical protein VGH75_09005, partial [Steroidobacteraceae bacterium]